MNNNRPSLQQIVERRFAELGGYNVSPASTTATALLPSSPSPSVSALSSSNEPSRTMTQSSSSASRIFLTPADRFTTPPPSERGGSTEARLLASQIAQSVKQSLDALSPLSSSSAAAGEQNDADDLSDMRVVNESTGTLEPFVGTSISASACKTQIHMEPETNEVISQRVCTDGVNVVVENQYVSVNNNNDDEGDMSAHTSTVISTPTEIVACTTSNNDGVRDDANTMQCVSVHSVIPGSYSDTVRINDEDYDPDDVLDFLASEEKIVFNGTDPISDAVRNQLIDILRFGGETIVVSRDGQRAYAVDVELQNDHTDEEGYATPALAATDSLLRERIATHLVQLQQSEHEFFIDVFEQYARYWAMKLGYSLKPHINFGIARFINDMAPDLIMGPEGEELAVTGDDVDILAYLAELSPSDTTVDKLDTLTQLVADEFGVSTVDAQRFTLPWVLRGVDALRMDYLPSNSEWEQFTADRERSNNLVDSIKLLRRRIAQRAAMNPQSVTLQPVDVTLSDGSFRARLNIVNPVLLKSAAYSVPMIGPLVNSESGRRPYVIHLSSMKRGAAFAPPLDFDIGETMLELRKRAAGAVAAGAVSSDEPARPIPDRTDAQRHQVIFVTTSAA